MRYEPRPTIFYALPQASLQMRVGRFLQTIRAVICTATDDDSKSGLDDWFGYGMFTKLDFIEHGNLSDQLSKLPSSSSFSFSAFAVCLFQVLMAYLR